MEESIPYAFSMAGKQAAEKGWNSGETGEWRPSGAEARTLHEAAADPSLGSG